MPDRKPSPFNSALETGVRTLTILVASYPNAHDLHRLARYDYLVVHSGDAGGPPSLHPEIPLRSGELLVRSQIVERGLLLMVSAKLVRRLTDDRGFLFVAEDAANTYLANLTAEYLVNLRQRAQWVVDTFDGLTAEQLSQEINKFFKTGRVEFQPTDTPYQMELPI